jgi:hypothetical protein
MILIAMLLLPCESRALTLYWVRLCLNWVLIYPSWALIFELHLALFAL